MYGDAARLGKSFVSGDDILKKVGILWQIR